MCQCFCFFFPPMFFVVVVVHGLFIMLGTQKTLSIWKLMSFSYQRSFHCFFDNFLPFISSISRTPISLILDLMDSSSSYLFSLIFHFFLFWFWEISSVFYVNVSMNYFCYYSLNFPELLWFFLQHLNFALWMHYFILFLRGSLLFFKRYSPVYIASISSHFLFSFPFLFDAIFLDESFSQLSGDPLLPLHI